jgi:curved DNA-binding protein CbpA
MATRETFLAWAESLQDVSYYTVLRVPPDATTAQVKESFHGIALRCHPDRFVDEPEDVCQAAGEVFKRAVEAYRVLSQPDLRATYDEQLEHGKVRIVEGSMPTPPPPAVLRTLEDLATSAKAKQFARRADLLLSVGKLDEARVALASACQDDPDNDELKERLDAIYEAMALEP